ncbi:MAG: ABC transporter permease [Proteobacteria bacterium]|nr:ABC transporter permease [Pseudomonadota bacterium]
MLIKNPILRREIEHRMRDNRTYFVPLVYTLILGVVSFSVYFIETPMFAYHYPVQGWSIGARIFKLVVLTQVILVCLFVPSISGSSITSERDRGTLVSLLVTPMSGFRIAYGKLLASSLYVGLLLSTSIPFAALSFGFGGTSIGKLFFAYLTLATTALSIAALGTLVSSVIRRTVPAVLLTYGMLVMLAIGNSAGSAILTMHSRYQGENLFSYINPLGALLMDTSTSNSDHHLVVISIIQVAISALFFIIAGARINTLRE